jgi:CubicO group peptidase (beta-lactamase class C family)
VIVESVDGLCDERFARVRDLLACNLMSGEELGAALVVDIEGRRLVDLYGGFRDQERTKPWERDTIVNVFSSTKTVTNLAALLLIDRGQLDPSEPVVRYWPGFEAGGKDAVRVWHVLSHQAGLPGWDPPFDLSDLYDWETATTRLAAQAPWWEPGTKSGYHGKTQGFLVGEIVRRIDGRSLPEFVAAELTGPLGADFQYGLGRPDETRVATIIPPPPGSRVSLDETDADSPVARVRRGSPGMPGHANTVAWRQSVIPGSNGHSNARGLADLLSIVSRGESSGASPKLSASTIDLIFEERFDDIDVILGIPLRWGTGYALTPSASVPYLPTGRVCFWGGWGGSMVVMDIDRKMTITYVMNNMAGGIIGSSRSALYLTAVYDAL